MNQDRTDLVESLRDQLKAAMPEDLAEQIALINALRVVIHEASPFAGEPVDLVQWVPADSVHSNDYNPNAVAPPEMELLRLSIMADGYTQPIVTNLDEDAENRTVIDGFHRNRVGKECADVAERIRGYLPVVQIKGDRTDRGDRIASTIRHNRARGKHAVSAMADIVLELKRRNWSDKKIGVQLGMDDDEVLRLAQITGLAEAFANRDFSQSWEAVLSDQDTDDLDDTELTNLADVAGELSDSADADA
jgi:ParB-like chromosome segregation protein Spo0J